MIKIGGTFHCLYAVVFLLIYPKALKAVGLGLLNSGYTAKMPQGTKTHLKPAAS